jgi:hypothetical protein
MLFAHNSGLVSIDVTTATRGLRVNELLLLEVLRKIKVEVMRVAVSCGRLI